MLLYGIMPQIMPPHGYRSITVEAVLFDKLNAAWMQSKEKPRPSFSDWVERILWRELEERSGR